MRTFINLVSLNDQIFISLKSLFISLCRVLIRTLPHPFAVGTRLDIGIPQRYFPIMNPFVSFDLSVTDDEVLIIHVLTEILQFDQS